MVSKIGTPHLGTNSLEYCKVPWRRERMKKVTIATLGAVLLTTASANAQWASLKGQFLYGKEGTKVPAADKLVVTKDVQVCGKYDLFNEQLTVNEENRGIANIVLWAFKPKKSHPDYEKTAKDTVQIDNLNCRFEPHVVAVRTTQTLRVGNPDPVGHNSLINFLKNKSVNPIIPAGGKVDFELTKAELIPVKVSCSIHPWMQGIVLVQDHPYMAVTDEDGKFEFKNLPAGKLTIKVWHEKAGYISDLLTIDGKKAKPWKKGRYSLTMADGKDEDHQYVVNPKAFAK